MTETPVFYVETQDGLRCLWPLKDDVMITKIETDDNGSVAVFVADAPAYSLNDLVESWSPYQDTQALPSRECTECPKPIPDGMEAWTDSIGCEHCTNGRQHFTAGPVTLVKDKALSMAARIYIRDNWGWSKPGYLCHTIPVREAQV